ncbi:putative odorant receptor 85d [Leptinotarsa decemlineata]|uniref:putative odorant receptor 85d n=1 Tax=Leptinotarsa decemlineata TaxID=7539 RepID=UPI003D305C73
MFNYTISWVQLLLTLTFSITQLSNLVKLSEALLFNSTQIAFVCKLLNFNLQHRSMLKLEEFLRQPTLTKVTEEEDNIIRHYVRGVRRIGLIFRVLCVVVVIFYALFPLMDRNPDGSKKLPLPIWLPFDSNKYYHTIWFSEVLSIAVGAWINSNIDILSYTLMTLGTAQFEILKNRLRNLVKTSNEFVEEDLVLEKMKQCVIHFNDINRLIDLIEKTLSNGIFVQFLCSVIFICMTGFQILVISFRSMQFVLLLTYFCCLTCQVVMYCWYGHILMNSSEDIAEACYMTEWFNGTQKIQRMFVIIMERAKRPVKLRAANFFYLNLQTLMAILRSSYSYFAVLWHIYSNQ